MELRKGYWEDVRQNCKIIARGLPIKQKWVLWPVAHMFSVSYAWDAQQPPPLHRESLTVHYDRLIPLGQRALHTNVTHELIIPDDPYPRLVLFNPKQERILHTPPRPDQLLLTDWREVGQPHYDLMYDALARGAAARQQEQ